MKKLKKCANVNLEVITEKRGQIKGKTKEVKIYEVKMITFLGEREKKQILFLVKSLDMFIFSLGVSFLVFLCLFLCLFLFVN